MEIKLFNTLKRALENFQPSQKSKVKLYTCGPTVYNHVHIGNLRAYISADILKRTLAFNGYDIDWVMNITDIDDKTIASSIKEFGPEADVEALEKFTQQYFGSFLEDLKKINVDEQDISFVKVTEKIADIQLYILELIKRGFAYKAEDGSTYFSIEKYQQKFGDYGALVGDKFLEGKKIGARVAVDEYEKENLSDFALWKAHAADDAKIFWNHPELGPGRPGWHIECTLINYFKFPSGTDIHTGGVDLMFPHHTNEIAQARPIYEPQEFVRYWIHSEHILVDNKKMAKRSGNFYTLSDLEKENIADGLSLRYLILQSHYRGKININKESLKAGKEGLNNLRKEIQKLLALAGKDAKQSPKKNGLPAEKLAKADPEFIKLFTASLNNDLNTPEALANMQALLKSDLPPAEKLATIYKMDEVFGLDLEKIIAEQFLDANSLEENIKKLLKERDQARKEKNFGLSDKLRKELESKGFDVKDTPEGTQIKNLS